MNEHQFGVCLSCNTPWIPSIKSFMSVNKLGSLSLLYFENECQNDEDLKARMVRGKIPRFVSKQNEAHVVHEAHHAHALKYSLQNLCNNDANVQNFPFCLNPGARRFQAYLASWGARRADRRVSHVRLFNCLKSIIPQVFENGQMAPEFHRVIRVCNECNTAMSMRFWFRYHLHTSVALNPSRIIPDDVIRVFHANTHGFNSLLPNDYQHWTRGNQLPNMYPDMAFSRNTDFFTAYLAYYLQLSLPINMNCPLDIPVLTWRNMMRVYMVLTWITLEIACLISEYKLGSRKRGKLTHTSKNILGNIELYLSYYYWIFTCFQDHRVQTYITFENWHLFYMCDLYGCTSFREHDVELLSLEIIPRNCDIPSREFIERVSSKIVINYTRHVRKLTDIITGQNNFTQEVYLHFVNVDDLQEIRELASRINTDIFDNVVTLVGIRAVWMRVMRLCVDFPESLKTKMKSLLDTWVTYEIKNVARNNGITYYFARRRYASALKNPEDTEYKRGVWASVLKLRSIKALDYDVVNPKKVDMFEVKDFNDLFKSN